MSEIVANAWVFYFCDKTVLSENHPRRSATSLSKKAENRLISSLFGCRFAIPLAKPIISYSDKSISSFSQISYREIPSAPLMLFTSSPYSCDDKKHILLLFFSYLYSSDQNSGLTQSFAQLESFKNPSLLPER